MRNECSNGLLGFTMSVGRKQSSSRGKEHTTQKRNSTRSKRGQGQIPSHPRGPDQKDKVLQKKFDRAKLLVNVGEYSQAMSSLLSNGTAPITEATLLQLSSKHPERSKPVCWPDPHPRETSEPRTGQHQPVIPMGAQMDIASIHPQMDIDRPEETAHPKMDIDNHEEKDPEKTTANMEIETEVGWSEAPEPGVGFPSISVNKNDILRAASSAKRYTSGGLQQITPWHLKRALFASSDNDCAIKASLLATRWGRGDFTTHLGELVAESKLIALFKDDKKIDVRPISVGCSLRRLLTKAYCSRTRARVNALVKDTQLGVLKAGYEIGVHAMRSLSKEASRNGEGILLLDFANAFNTVDRNLMISLASKDCPELANLTWWLYKLQPWLITTRGDVIRSSSGTQQGCRLSNPLIRLNNAIHR